MAAMTSFHTETWWVHMHYAAQMQQRPIRLFVSVVSFLQCLVQWSRHLYNAIRVFELQVLNRSLDPRASPTDVQDMTSAQMTSLLTPFPASMAATVLVPQQLITCGTTRNCVRMRGLPMEVTVADILSILGDCSRHIIYQGVHLVYSSSASRCSLLFFSSVTSM